MTVKKGKSGGGQEHGAKYKREYIYFKQLSFLLPICKSKTEEEEVSEIQEERNKRDENKLPDPPIPPKKKKKKTPASDEQLLLQTLARNVEKKANTADDPDKHFLLSLLPHFKSLTPNAKLEAMGDFICILKKYIQHPSLVSQQFYHHPSHFFSGPASLMNQAPHYIPSNTRPSNSVGTQYQPIHVDCGSPESATRLPSMSPMSDSSSICDEYFS